MASDITASEPLAYLRPVGPKPVAPKPEEPDDDPAKRRTEEQIAKEMAAIRTVY